MLNIYTVVGTVRRSQILPPSPTRNLATSAHARPLYLEVRIELECPRQCADFHGNWRIIRRPCGNVKKPIVPSQYLTSSPYERCANRGQSFVQGLIIDVQRTVDWIHLGWLKQGAKELFDVERAAIVVCSCKYIRVVRRVTYATLFV